MCLTAFYFILGILAISAAPAYGSPPDGRVALGSATCPFSVYYEPVCASDNATYANIEALQCRNIWNQKNQSHVMAHRECQILDCTRPHQNNRVRGRCLNGAEECRSNPVCASNGQTFANVEAFRCAKQCNLELQVRHEGGCTVHEVRRCLGSGDEVKTRACALKKARRSEWNPVCGKDNVTYQNPYYLLCRKPNVHYAYTGACGTPLQRACQRAKEINEMLRASYRTRLVLPRTPGYDRVRLVCGSDGKTYRSYHHLRCSKQHNKYLYCRHKGRCRRRDLQCENIPKALCNEGLPVCGTDGKSYIGPKIVYCARDPKISYLHEGMCIK